MRSIHNTLLTSTATLLLAASATAPAAPGDQPVVRGDQPVVRGDQPVVRGDQPAVRGDQPVAALPQAKAGDNKARQRTTSLPARGLFVGDQLSDATKQRLTELILDAISLQVEVALLVPTGPWTIDGAGHTDRDLNAARLAALRQFLQQRGVDPKKIFVESRIDPRLTEPRLDVQLLGQPAD